jgi:hypothetical protein
LKIILPVSGLLEIPSPLNSGSLLLSIPFVGGTAVGVRRDVSSTLPYSSVKSTLPSKLSWFPIAKHDDETTHDNIIAHTITALMDV